MPRVHSRPRAPDLEQLEAERFDPAENAMQRGLVRQFAGQHRLVIADACVHLGEGAEQPVAQEASNADLVLGCRAAVVHGGQGRVAPDEAASTGSCEPADATWRRTCQSGRQARDALARLRGQAAARDGIERSHLGVRAYPGDGLTLPPSSDAETGSKCCLGWATCHDCGPAETLRTTLGRVEYARAAGERRGPALPRIGPIV